MVFMHILMLFGLFCVYHVRHHASHVLQEKGGNIYISKNTNILVVNYYYVEFCYMYSYYIFYVNSLKKVASNIL